jgi:hypothetical protein
MQKELIAGAVAICLLSLAWFGGLFGGDVDDFLGESDLEPFPVFSTVADDGLTYSNSDYEGAPYIVIFSAEWCDSPCHSTMHAINSTLNGPPIMVFSTDPADSPQGINLTEWHDRSNSYDDEGDDLGQTLDFPFAKGIEQAEEVKISSRPSIVFVNSDGGIVNIHKGGLSDSEVITSNWESAGGTL